MAVPLAAPTEREELYERRSAPVKRTPEQEQARIQQAKILRQGQNSYANRRAPLLVAQSSSSAVTDQNAEEISSSSEAEERVGRLRSQRAQVLLAAQEEAERQTAEQEAEKPTLMPYMPAFSVGALKDTLDLLAIGSVPVLGTFITLICSILIFFLTIFAKKNGSIEDMGFIIRRLLIVLVGFLVEGFVFGVNFFPFEIATVAVIYFMDKHLSIKQIAVLQNITHSLSKKRL